jgi:hypothetical protein
MSFPEEDFSDHHYDFEFGYEGSSPSNKGFRPTFSYKYIDLGKTEFHFHREEFDEKDRRTYFERLKNFSQQSLEYILDRSSHTLHFKLNPDSRNREYHLLSELVDIDFGSGNAYPVLGHFALYTPTYEEGKKNKAPRIFFLVGENAVLHILFYDPFHEIHPIAESTKKSLSNHSQTKNLDKP